MMNRALQLALRGRGLVEPNPMVGAVVARHMTLLGAGYHAVFGGPHAEVNALADCRARGHDPAGATMYVTLEPCCHHGKTPPCTDALIAAGIAEVVVAMVDPFDRVAGKGIDRLREAGIGVTVGRMESQARRLNESFIKRITAGRPWIIAKWAQTLDGHIATASGHSQWISSPVSRDFVHDLRGRVDAIVTGIGTVIADDPALTARGEKPKRLPRRIVVGPREMVPPHARLLNDAGPEVMFCDDVPALDALLRKLAKEHGVTNVLVEAGGGLVGKLFAHGLIDQVLAFVAPKLLGDDAAPGPARGMQPQLITDTTALELIHTQRFGDDMLLDYRVQQTPAVACN